RGSLVIAAAAVAGALPATLGFLALNHALTGSAFQTVYGLYNRVENAVYGAADARTAVAIGAFNLSRLSVWPLGIAPGLLAPLVGPCPARPGGDRRGSSALCRGARCGRRARRRLHPSRDAAGAPALPPGAASAG